MRTHETRTLITLSDPGNRRGIQNELQRIGIDARVSVPVRGKMNGEVFEVLKEGHRQGKPYGVVICDESHRTHVDNYCQRVRGRRGFVPPLIIGVAKGIPAEKALETFKDLVLPETKLERRREKRRPKTI